MVNTGQECPVNRQTGMSAPHSGWLARGCCDAKPLGLVGRAAVLKAPRWVEGFLDYEGVIGMLAGRFFAGIDHFIKL